MHSPKSRWPGVLLAVASSWASSAHAEEAPSVPEGPDASAVARLQAAIDGVDPVFAQWVVTPMFKVLFFDALFWDDGTSKVNDLAFAGLRLVSGGEDGGLVVWDGARPSQTFDLGAGPVRAVAARPGHAGQVAVGLGTGEVRLVEVGDGNTTRNFDGLSGAPTRLVFDASGATLLAASDNGMVRAWSVDTGEARTMFRQPGTQVLALAVDGSTTTAQARIAWSTSGPELLLGRLASAEAPRALAGHRRGVSAIVFAEDGAVVSGGEDGRVLFHPRGAAEPSRTLALSQDPAIELAFTSPSRLLVARPGGVQALELKDGRWSETRRMKADVGTMTLGTSSSLAVAKDQGQVVLFNADSGLRRATATGHATEATLPFIVLWLVAGAIFFTLRFSFINLRAFGHAIAVTRGKYDHDSEDGDVSHFQALAMALSATVGLGNIAGVAVAVGTGGPGAVFWMIVAGFLGMSSKFAECTLGQMYRKTDAQGRVSGGPMHYLKDGLSEMGMGGLGRVLSVLFAILCIGGSLGGGNMFQANQSYQLVQTVLPVFQGEIGSLMYGLVLSGLVGVVIIGGIHRIGQVASLIVPFMVGIYILAALFIVLANVSAVPGAFAEIFARAFSPGAAFGGALGVMVTGFRRAAFSNEAGVGSASIAHSAAATQEPVREGIVALLEPFIDTIVVCTTTALVLVITGAYQTEANGVVMTSKAFETVLPWFPNVLTVAVFLFAFSTMISWSYYGERCWGYLFGEGRSLIYKLIFLGAVVVGSVVRLGSVLDFSDLMILAMAFPNILGVVLLSGKVRARLVDYMARLRSGEMSKAAAEG